MLQALRLDVWQVERHARKAGRDRQARRRPDAGRHVGGLEPAPLPTREPATQTASVRLCVDRMRNRIRSSCDENHKDPPGRARILRYKAIESTAERQAWYDTEVWEATPDEDRDDTGGRFLSVQGLHLDPRAGGARVILDGDQVRDLCRIRDAGIVAAAAIRESKQARALVGDANALELAQLVDAGVGARHLLIENGVGLVRFMIGQMRFPADWQTSFRRGCSPS